MVRVSDANSKTLSSSLNSRGQTSSTPLSIDDIEKDDQVSTEHLRASLRILLGASHDNATLFVSIVRAKLEEPSAASFDDLESLFAEPGPSQSLIDLLSMTRIRLTAGVVVPAFDLFAVLPFGVTERRIRIRPGNLRSKLVEGGGDMVQAAQAFKESGDRSEKAKSSLMNLIDRLLECREYCLSSDCFFPFARAVPQMIDTAQLVFKSSIKAFHIPEYTTVHQVRRCPKPLPQIQLGRLEVPRLFFGLWQLSSPAWGSASHEEIIEGMGEMISNGLVAADMAGEHDLLS